jgi:hypothetical protein
VAVTAAVTAAVLSGSGRGSGDARLQPRPVSRAPPRRAALLASAPRAVEAFSCVAAAPRQWEISSATLDAGEKSAGAAAARRGSSRRARGGEPSTWRSSVRSRRCATASDTARSAICGGRNRAGAHSLRQGGPAIHASRVKRQAGSGRRAPGPLNPTNTWPTPSRGQGTARGRGQSNRRPFPSPRLSRPTAWPALPPTATPHLRRRRADAAEQAVCEVRGDRRAAAAAAAAAGPAGERVQYELHHRRRAGVLAGWRSGGGGAARRWRARAERAVRCGDKGREQLQPPIPGCRSGGHPTTQAPQAPTGAVRCLPLRSSSLAAVTPAPHPRRRVPPAAVPRCASNAATELACHSFLRAEVLSMNSGLAPSTASSIGADARGCGCAAGGAAAGRPASPAPLGRQAARAASAAAGWLPLIAARNAVGDASVGRGAGVGGLFPGRPRWKARCFPACRRPPALDSGPSCPCSGAARQSLGAPLLPAAPASGPHTSPRPHYLTAAYRAPAPAPCPGPAMAARVARAPPAAAAAG